MKIVQVLPFIFEIATHHNFIASHSIGKKFILYCTYSVYFIDIVARIINFNERNIRINMILIVSQFTT